MACFKGIEIPIHMKISKIHFVPNSTTRGHFSSAITRKHGNRHKTKTKANTRVVKGSIPMFSWSENSFMELF